MNPEMILETRLEVLRILVARGDSSKTNAELAKAAIEIADALCEYKKGSDLDARLRSVNW